MIIQVQLYENNLSYMRDVYQLKLTKFNNYLLEIACVMEIIDSMFSMLNSLFVLFGVNLEIGISMDRRSPFHLIWWISLGLGIIYVVGHCIILKRGIR